MLAIFTFESLKMPIIVILLMELVKVKLSNYDKILI